MSVTSFKNKELSRLLTLRQREYLASLSCFSIFCDDPSLFWKLIRQTPSSDLQCSFKQDGIVHTSNLPILVYLSDNLFFDDQLFYRLSVLLTEDQVFTTPDNAYIIDQTMSQPSAEVSELSSDREMIPVPPQKGSRKRSLPKIQTFDQFQVAELN